MAVYFLPKSRMKKFLGRTDLPADVVIVDISGKSTANPEWAALSPTFNHGGIPVPGMAGRTARTVEGIWEGLKVFEVEGEALDLLDAEKPKKRRLSANSGKVLGHRYGDELLKDAVDARRRIFIPAYTWMVKNCPEARAKFDALVELSRTRTVHIHDGEENTDVHNPKPFAYASLLADMIKEETKKAKAAALV